MTPANQILPLTSTRLDGEPYRRRDDVEVQIRTALSTPKDRWEAMALATGAGSLSSEALVHLIRTLRDTDRDLQGRLIGQLNRRTIRKASRFLRGFDPLTADDILFNVERQIIEALLSKEPSRQSDFLEVSFSGAVQRRTLNLIEKSKNSPGPLRLGQTRQSEDGEESEQFPTESIPDEQPGVEELIIRFQDMARSKAIIRKARELVRDPRHLEAAILHHVFDWPLTSQDANEPSLARHFNRSSRRIADWIKYGLEAMRKVIGDQHE